MVTVSAFVQVIAVVRLAVAAVITGNGAMVTCVLAVHPFKSLVYNTMVCVAPVFATWNVLLVP